MPVLVDTGPLVAVASPDDRYHELCVRTLESLPAPLLTCWPVIAEAAWLLRDHPRGFQRILESFREGFLAILPTAGSEAAAIAEIIKRYASVRGQFCRCDARVSRE